MHQTYSSDFDNEDVPDGEYADVTRERQRTYRNTEDALRIYNLKKTYPGSGGKPDVFAVKVCAFL